MDERPRRVGGPPHLFLGLLIVTLGVIFFLDQQGIFPAREAFHFFWAAVLIFWGVQILAHARSGAGNIWGAVLIVFGAVSVANELGFLHIRLGALWPLALVAFGVWMLLGATGRVSWRRGPSEWREWGDKAGSSMRTGDEWQKWGKNANASASFAGTADTKDPCQPASQAPETGDAEFNQTALFSGFKRRITSQHFKFAKVATVFGGFNLDFTRADMDGIQAVIHVDSVFGGGEIRVPEAWNVQIEGTALAGAFVDETYPRPADLKPIKNFIVRGSVVFGGVVIKN